MNLVNLRRLWRATRHGVPGRRRRARVRTVEYVPRVRPEALVHAVAGPREHGVHQRGATLLRQTLLGQDEGDEYIEDELPQINPGLSGL